MKTIQQSVWGFFGETCLQENLISYFSRQLLYKLKCNWVWPKENKMWPKYPQKIFSVKPQNTILKCFAGSLYGSCSAVVEEGDKKEAHLAQCRGGEMVVEKKNPGQMYTK